MNTTRVEAVPLTWDEARDGAFFRLTGRLFAPHVCLGATVLLASYDADADTDADSDTAIRPLPPPATTAQPLAHRSIT